MESKLTTHNFPKNGNKLRVCILDVAKGFTIESCHLLYNFTSQAVDSRSKSDPNTTPNPAIEYPHDAHEIVKQLDPECEYEIVYLRPNPRYAVSEIRRRKNNFDIFINLYDLSDQTGQKIVDYMEENGIAFTGAGSKFYDPTRQELKRLCTFFRIDTPLHCFVTDTSNVHQLPQKLGGFPLFVKPEHGYDSVGIDAESIVHDLESLTKRISLVCQQFGGALVEHYVDGREFSVLIVKGGNQVDKKEDDSLIKVFPPVEYIFPELRKYIPPTDSSAPASPSVSSTFSTVTKHTQTHDTKSPSNNSQTDEKSNDESRTREESEGDSKHPSKRGPNFITFEDKWGASFHNHWRLVSNQTTQQQELVTKLQKVAKDLFVAFNGSGYCRVDIREDSATGKLMVLDINPNCSIFYESECTLDTIIRLSGWTKPQFLKLLFDEAFQRQALFQSQNQLDVVYVDSEKGFVIRANRDIPESGLVYSDEMSSLRVVTRDYVTKHWTISERQQFDMYAWPLGDDVYAIWDTDSTKWKPVNHSCDPNCWMDGLEVRARRNIKKGEELTFDYATFVPELLPFECWCGASNCRKQFKPNEYKEPWFELRYKGHYSPYVRAKLAQFKQQQIEQQRQEQIEQQQQQIEQQRQQILTLQQQIAQLQSRLLLLPSQ